VFVAGDAAGDCEADSLIAKTDDRGVDADDFSLDIQERSAAVAGIHGRVGLQILLEVVGEAAFAATALGADNAERIAAIETVGTAHSPDHVADFEVVAATPLGRDQIWQVDFDHREIEQAIGAGDRGVGSSAIAELDFDRAGLTNDVEVGHDVSRRVDNHAGTLTVVPQLAGEDNAHDARIE